MESIANFLNGFDTAFVPNNLLYAFMGVLLGTIIGVLPGIGPLAAISVLLPFTYGIDPTAALMMLAGIYYGAQYGGATTSILLNLPGVASHAVTCLDGYPLAQQGRAGAALFMSMLSSFIGASIGISIMVLFSPVIASFALEFGPAEYCSIMVLGLLAASTLSHGSPAKGIAMVVLGLLIGVVGLDIYTGRSRLTFDVIELGDGFSIAALAMGLFGIADLFSSVNRIKDTAVQTRSVTLRSMRATADDLRQSWAPILRGSGLGAFFGILPGTGATIASFVSYAVEKKVSRTPEKFGRGAIQGVSGPEASNNAAAQTAFIPTLTLAIPGDSTMALILGALIIHGIQPGPTLITEHPDIFWGLIASFWIGNLILLVLNIPLIGIWVRLLTVPYRLIYPAVLYFICVGVYATNNSFFDVGVVLCFGLLGFVLNRLNFPLAPVLLGFVLSTLLEDNFRRSLLMSRGELSIFVTEPLSAFFLAVAVALVVGTAFSRFRQRRRGVARAGTAQP